jgi:hypothetical protein
MKVLLSEKQLSFIIENSIDTDLNELKMDDEGHFYERIHSRWYSSSKLNLVLRVNGDNYPIGYYFIPKEEKEIIDNKINYLIDLEKELDPNLNIGIKIHKFQLSLNSPNVLIPNRASDYYKNVVSLANKDYSSRLYVSDEKTKSVGDVVYVIIKQGKLKTIYFARPSDLNPEKRGTDYVFSDPHELENL